MSTNHETQGASPTRPLGLLAVAAVALIAGAVWFSSAETSSKVANDSDVFQRETGAGTNPDGIADGTIEGLTDGEGGSSVVNSSNASDLNPGPSLDAVGPEPQETATGLEPAAGDADPVARMTDDS